MFPSTGMAISELWQAQFGKGDAQLTPVVFLSQVQGSLACWVTSSAEGLSVKGGSIGHGQVCDCQATLPLDLSIVSQLPSFLPEATESILTWTAFLFLLSTFLTPGSATRARITSVLGLLKPPTLHPLPFHPLLLGPTTLNQTPLPVPDCPCPAHIA